MGPVTKGGAKATVEINDSIEDLGKGSKVWYKKDDDTWVSGELASNPGATCSVLLETGQTVQVASNLLQPANAQLQDGIPDLTQLSYLNEPSILYDLQLRYQTDEIYTYAGPVLIAINPCKNLPLYTNDIANKYKKGASVYVNDLEPHIYLVAANAFREMVRVGRSQSLIVSGESGAGKTETTKKAMQYFATLAGGTGVEDQVLETNPILEAFGNAKTMRNHNSSRFGKLIEIHFNTSHRIAGARIRTYLLEKSRVVNQLKGERSYHIFYQLVKGASSEQRNRYKLPASVTSFNYLNQSGCTEIEGMDDAAEFREVQKALLDLGVSHAALSEVWSVIAGILWLGNTTFTANKDDEAALARSEAATNACELLGTTHDALSRALTNRTIRTKDEVITKVIRVEEAREARDALAKAIYAGVFNWVVVQVNRKLDTGRSMGANCIAILDIYGFEQFQKNSFEQLCINYANERLQQQFNRHLFELEQAEYAAEGIDWAQVEFTDNQRVLDVIEATPPKGLGVLSVLDAQCKFPKASDNSFLEKLKEVLTGHSHFGVVPRAPEDFVIKHYAGSVQYTSAGFLDKNKDTLSPDLVLALVESRLQMVAEMGAQVMEEAGDRRGTVASRFTSQLRDLVNMLDTTGLHFVRCIKPNPGLKPNEFQSIMTLQQLRCCGVLEVVRIARAGFPTRYLLTEFLDRYQVLLPGGRAANEVPMAAIQRLIKMFSIPEGQYQIGRRKIFFRAGILGYVEDCWQRMQRASGVLQNFFCMLVQRRKFLRLRAAALLVQTAFRATCDRKQLTVMLREHRAAKKIQHAWLGHSTRQRYLSVRAASITLVMYWRRYQLAQRVKVRRHEREKRELMERLAEEERKRREESFEAMQREFGVDINDVKVALAAYLAAQKDPTQLNAAMSVLAGGQLPPALLAQAAAQQRAPEPEPEEDPEEVARKEEERRQEEERRREEEEAQAIERKREAEEREVQRMKDERKEDEAGHLTMLQVKQLELENQKLKKQLELEKGLRERSNKTHQEQAQEWVDQIRVLKEHIHQQSPPPPQPSAPSSHTEFNTHTPPFVSPFVTPNGTPTPVSCPPNHHSHHTPHNGYHLEARATANGSEHNGSYPSQSLPSYPSGDHYSDAGSSGNSSQGGGNSSQSGTPLSGQNHYAATQYVQQLSNDFERVTSVLGDDVQFLREVKEGLQEAHGCDPAYELHKLKLKFSIWKREFKSKLKTTEEILKKLDRIQKQMTTKQATPTMDYEDARRQKGVFSRLTSVVRR